MSDPRDTAPAHARRIRWRERLLDTARRVPQLRGMPTGWADGCTMLLYHQLNDGGSPSADPFSVSMTAFEAQMEWLAAHRTVITAGDLCERLRNGRSVEGTAVVTFDDGYECTVSRAVPALRRRGLVATIFLTCGPAVHARMRLAEALAATGMEIGSHTMAHADLRTLEAAALDDELAESREYVRALTGQEVIGFAYPYGSHDDRVVDAVRRAGYAYGCTCLQHENNSAHTPWFRLRRVEVNAQDGLARWRRKLDGEYGGVYDAWYRLTAPGLVRASA